MYITLNAPAHTRCIWRNLRLVFHASVASLVNIMAGKCSFNACWLTKTEYKSWLRDGKGDLHKVVCVVGKKTVNLTSILYKKLQKPEYNQLEQKQSAGMQLN